MNRNHLLICLICFMSLAGLAACAGPVTPLPPLLATEEPGLPFQTIASGHLNGSVVAANRDDSVLREGDFIVITNAEEVTSRGNDLPGIEVQLAPNLVSQLESVDYQRHFVILALRWEGAISAQDTLEVRRIRRPGAEVIIEARYGQAPWNQPMAQAESYPCHILAVEKEGVWGRDIRFALVVGGREVKAHTYFIP